MSDYETESQNIRKLSALPPDQLIDHLSNLHNTLGAVAPNIAPHIYSGAANAIQFLNSKLAGSGNELMQDKHLPPSQAEQTRWLDFHKVVNDPISVLNHVNEGTLNSHHIEALQTIYPDLHQEMVQKTLENLGAMKMKGQQVPYSKRISISKFIGQPTDSTMTQQSMQTILSSASINTGPAAQAAQGKSKASGSELNQINKVNKIVATPLQASETKKLQ